MTLERNEKMDGVMTEVDPAIIILTFQKNTRFFKIINKYFESELK